MKTKIGKPAHVNKNDDVRYHFQCLKSGWFGRRLSRLTNADMSDHFGGTKTFYFTADGRSSTPEVLVNIDIDCHKSGSLAGAIAFAEHLRSAKFSNLYYEASTNGKGVHGYIVVEKGDLGDEGLNGALVVLDRWLEAELSNGYWDVEVVEIKGHCPEFTWGREKFELKSYKSGQLAKLPRQALARADELRGTTKVTVDELRKLPVPTADESEASVVHRARKARLDSSFSVPESENWEQEPSVVPEKAKKTKSGSIAGHHFGEEELAKLGGGYLSLAKEFLGDRKLVATGRRVVTEEDVAVFLMILKFFSNNMNADGSLPVARWRGMWGSLFSAGDVGRAWCHHRFATMRNFLTDQGLLSWEEEEFVVGVVDEAGWFMPGRASKWKAGEELMAKLEAVEVGEAGVVVGVGGVEAVGIEEVKEKEEGGGILYGNNQTHPHLDEPVTGQDNPSKASQTHQTTTTTPKPGQSTSFLDLIDALGLWVPLPRPRFAGYATGTYRKAA